MNWKVLGFLVCLILFIGLFNSHLFFGLHIVCANPTYENYTTYTEVDPNNHISVANSTHIDFQDYNDDSAYIYIDKGSGHFIDFTHLVTVKPVSGQNLHTGYFWVLSNDLNDFWSLKTTEKKAIGAAIYKGSTGSK